MDAHTLLLLEYVVGMKKTLLTCSWNGIGMILGSKIRQYVKEKTLWESLPKALINILITS